MSCVFKKIIPVNAFSRNDFMFYQWLTIILLVRMPLSDIILTK